MHLVSKDDIVLKTKSVAVILPDEFDAIVKIGGQMIKLMNKSGGAGLAANQVGIAKTFFVWHFGVVINPEITHMSAEKECREEGCLSFPKEIAHKCRAKSISVKYINERNQEVLKNLTGFAARVFLHEYDHINGVTIFDEKSE